MRTKEVPELTPQEATFYRALGWFFTLCGVAGIVYATYSIWMLRQALNSEAAPESCKADYWCQILYVDQPVREGFASWLALPMWAIMALSLIGTFAGLMFIWTTHLTKVTTTNVHINA